MKKPERSVLSFREDPGQSSVPFPDMAGKGTDQTLFLFQASGFGQTEFGDEPIPAGKGQDENGPDHNEAGIVPADDVHRRKLV